MSYLVKEVFLTLQGEGAHTGRTAVFCRFTGCNLWTGREEHRSIAVCQFCDTDFVGTDGPGGGHFADAATLAAHIVSFWPTAPDGNPGSGADGPYVVCTGGEPLLQLDDALLDALHRRNATIAIETNGTIAIPSGVDWVCVSPKAGADLIVNAGDECKVVFPQPGAEPERFEAMAFTHFFVQPMDGPNTAANTEAAIAWCLAHPRWRLSTQTHKHLELP